MAESGIHMKGGGYYSAHTIGAKHVIDRAGELIFDRFSRLRCDPPGRSFNIADYGAADGGTSLDLIGKIIAKARNRAPNHQISVTYTDLPHNDFSSLFRMLQGQIEGVSSYLAEYRDVFVSCSGTSFYEQIVSNAMVDLGFSATAMHWLSGMPGTIANHVHAVGAQGEELQAFRDHAIADWEKILLSRADEMAPGGLLVMANFCIDEQGRYLGNTRGANMFDTFDRLWSDLVTNGMLDESEYQATAFPQFYKTLDEFRAPFDDPESAVSRCGLKLEDAFTAITECPYRAEFDRAGDPAMFADAYLPTLRSWSENVFINGLNPARSVSEKNAVVDQFYKNYNTLVRDEPHRHSMDYVHVYMAVTKEA